MPPEPVAPPPLLLPRPPPSAVRVVDPFGRGGFTSVAAALVGAPAGTRIEIHPGDYEAALAITAPVHLVGLGTLGQIVLRNPAGPAISTCADLELTNLTLRSNAQVIVASAGTTTTLSTCELSAAAGPALSIATDFRLRSCRIGSGAGPTVIFNPGTAGHLEFCTIGAVGDALTVLGGAHPTVTSCLVNSSSGRAVAVYPGGAGRFAENELRASGTTVAATVGVGLGASPTLVGNVIATLNGGALAILGGGSYTGNTLTSVAAAWIPAVFVGAAAAPVLRSNLINATNSNALHIAGRGYFEDNTLTGGPGSWATVTVGPGAAPMLRRNTITSATCTALALRPGAAGSYEHNTITSDAPIQFAAVSVGPSSDPTFHANQITAEHGNALWVRGPSGGVYAWNRLQSSGRATVEWTADAALSLLQNDIRSPRGSSHMRKPFFSGAILVANQLSWLP